MCNLCLFLKNFTSIRFYAGTLQLESCMINNIVTVSSYFLHSIILTQTHYLYYVSEKVIRPYSVRRPGGDIVLLYLFRLL